MWFVALHFNCKDQYMLLNHREQMVVFRRDKIVRRLLEELDFDVIFLNETMVTSHSRCVAVFTFITDSSPSICLLGMFVCFYPRYRDQIYH
jgi:hypothetical protein